MTDQVFQYIVDQTGAVVYLTILAILLLAGLGVPIPEDIPLLAGGYLAHRGRADPWLVTATGMFGVLLGDTLIFLAGRRWGTALVETRFMGRLLPPRRIEAVRQVYAKYGDLAVFVGRFTVGLRPAVFATAGMTGMPLTKFLTFDGLAAAISVPLWVWLAYTLGDDVDRWLGQLDGAKHWAILALLVVVVGGLVWWKVSRGRHPKT